MPIRYPLDIATFNKLTVSASSATAALTVEQLSGATGDLLSLKSGASVVGSISALGVATLPRMTLTGNLTNLAIQPVSSEYATDTKIIDVKRKDNTQLMWLDAEGDVYIKGDLTVEGTTQYSDTQHIAGDLTVDGNIVLKDSTGAYVLKAVNASGTVVDLEISSNIVLTGSTQTVDGIQIATHDHSGTTGKGTQISYANLTNKPSSGSWDHDTTVNGSRLWSTGTDTTTPYHISQSQGKTWQDHMAAAAASGTLGHVKIGTGLSISSGVVSVSYGVAAETACQGNDARLSDARTPLAHEHIDKARGQYMTGTAPATQSWCRIAKSPSGMSDCIGIFNISTPQTGSNGNMSLAASISYAQQPCLAQISCSRYTSASISKARIVHHTSYSGNYAYLEVFMGTALALEVNLVGQRGWELINPMAGEIPEGYTSIELTLEPGIVTTGNVVGSDIRRADGTTVSYDGHEHPYLPTAGGTMTGNIDMGSNSIAIGNYSIAYNAAEQSLDFIYN